MSLAPYEVSLLVPFSSKDPARVKLFQWTIGRWIEFYGDQWEICVGAPEAEPFNRSAARNQAFEACAGQIIVLSDADTCCTPEQVNEAIERVRAGAPWVIAHDKYYSLTPAATDRLLTEPVDVKLEPPFDADWVMKARSVAGVLVMSRAAWEVAGGYDERFELWGYEDAAFAVKMDKKWGKHERVLGPMLHLWHPRGEGETVADFSQPNIEYNRALYEEIYRAA